MKKIMKKQIILKLQKMNNLKFDNHLFFSTQIRSKLEKIVALA